MKIVLTKTDVEELVLYALQSKGIVDDSAVVSEINIFRDEECISIKSDLENKKSKEEIL